MCLGGTLFIYFIKWDSFNSIINNEADDDVLGDTNSKNYQLLLVDEETAVNPINNTHSIDTITNDDVEDTNPPAINFFFGWVKYL